MNIFVFLDNEPFASAGFLFGLESLTQRCSVKSFFPVSYVSGRANIDKEIELSHCFPIDYDQDFTAFCQSEENELSGGVFVSYGYTGKSFMWARKLSKMFSGLLFVISEKPKVIKRCKALRLFLVYLKHFSICHLIRNEVDGLFYMGSNGKKLFNRLGWPKDKLFSFGYCPLIDMNSIVPCQFDEEILSYQRKFVFCGRLSFAKSPQRLISYFKSNNKECLLIIGGYGEQKKKFEIMCKGINNIYFLGVKTLQESVGIFSSCDCVLIPSTVDGWNVNVNLALAAETPVIITNNCGSDVVIKRLKNGVVTKNSKRSFKDGISTFVNNEKDFSSYVKKAKFALAPEIFAEYFLDIVESKYGNYENDQNEVPWNL